MTLEVRVWVSSIRDGWQVDRARRPQARQLDLSENRDRQWLLLYILAQQLNAREETRATAER